MEYEYKVTSFQPLITTEDLRSGEAPNKISAQLEILLQEHARDEWELQGQYQFDVQVQSKSFFTDTALKLMKYDTGEGMFRTFQLVFRKPM
jgi:hypothetical protein